MLKSNGSYLYGDIGSIFFQTFYFNNILNIDEIHILNVVILFHIIISLQHPCVAIIINLHANIDFHYLVVQMLNNVFLFSLHGN
jgi:hypothetical protein